MTHEEAEQQKLALMEHEAGRGRAEAGSTEGRRKSRTDRLNALKPLVKTATKMTFVRSSEVPDGGQLKSQCGGQPYFEKGEAWPVNRTTGAPLEFVFQVFNDGTLALPESVKLLQLYYDFNGDSAWRTNDGGWLVKVYENPRSENCEFIKKPVYDEGTTVSYGEVSFEKVVSLPDDEGIGAYLAEAAYWADYEEIAEELIGEENFYSHSSRLGGYPRWIQGDETPGADFVLLFQLDADDDFHDSCMIFGDCGKLYIFYDAKGKKFELTVQCY